MISFTIPLKAPSVANQRMHWAAKARQTKKQRDAARLLCPAWTEGPLLRVTLTRVGPRPLDDDNCASALKGVRDGIAARLGVDDGSPLIRWHYTQVKGEPCVRVSIERVREMDRNDRLSNAAPTKERT